MPEVSLSQLDSELADWVASCALDPYKFVMGAYPWQEEGPLREHKGPDKWQEKFLKHIGNIVKKNGFNGKKTVQAIRESVSSGHGVGKSTMVAWLVDWIMSTRPYCRGTITANTFTQLETKTWASVQTWTKLCITSHWFIVTSNRMYQKDHKESWFCSPQSSKEDNSESFAGQHAETSTSFYIMDEASAIPDTIYEVAEGGLTDGEPMIFLFGNPTRNSGTFFHACFGKFRGRWHQTIIDSRESRFTNKEQIKEWEMDYGEDSDFFRVRVKGQAPNASDSQFIDHQRVLDAQERIVYVPPDEPLIVGVDMAWGGCFDGQTEILTDRGWKFFETLDGSERVLTLNGDVSEWGPITKIHRYRHDGFMNLQEADSANFCVTDNHNFLVRTHQKSERYELRRYDSLPAVYMIRASNTWGGVSPSSVSFETVKQQPNGGQATYRLDFNMVDFASFLGWFVSEGNVYTAKPRNGYKTRALVIELSQRKQAGRDSINSLLSKMGIKTSQWSKHGTTRFQSKALGEWLLRECGHKAANKRVPVSIKDGSPEVIEAFLSSFLAGDGTMKKDGTGRCHGTSSLQLANDLQEMLAKVGRAGKMSKGEPAGSATKIEGRLMTRKHQMYSIYERQGKSRKSSLNRDRFITKSKAVRIPYSGLVWCVSTPHRTIYVRRHGVPMWSGNSDENVIRFRRGKDARSIPAIRIKGEFTRDPSIMVHKLADVLSREWNGRKVDMMFLDSAGIAGAVAPRVRELGHNNIREVNFGADSPHEKRRFMRDHMWTEMKEWLLTGAIDKHPGLESDLTAPGTRNDNKQRVWLESKETMKRRGVDSPDDADALALTFAAPVAVSTFQMFTPYSLDKYAWC